MVQRGTDDPAVVRISLGPCRRSGGVNHGRLTFNERNGLVSPLQRYRYLLDQHTLELAERVLGYYGVVRRQHDVEDLGTDTPKRDGGYQNVGVQHDPH